MALNEVYDEVKEGHSPERKISKADIQLGKFQIANTNYVKK